MYRYVVSNSFPFPDFTVTDVSIIQHTLTTLASSTLSPINGGGVDDGAANPMMIREMLDLVVAFLVADNDLPTLFALRHATTMTHAAVVTGCSKKKIALSNAVGQAIAKRYMRLLALDLLPRINAEWESREGLHAKFVEQQGKWWNSGSERNAFFIDLICLAPQRRIRDMLDLLHAWMRLNGKDLTSDVRNMAHWIATIFQCHPVDAAHRYTMFILGTCKLERTLNEAKITDVLTTLHNYAKQLPDLVPALGMLVPFLVSTSHLFDATYTILRALIHDKAEEALAMVWSTWARCTLKRHDLTWSVAFDALLVSVWEARAEPIGIYFVQHCLRAVVGSLHRRDLRQHLYTNCNGSVGKVEGKFPANARQLSDMINDVDDMLEKLGVLE